VTVVKIYLTATEFTDGSNKRLVARNADLIGQTITNLRRSGDAAVSLSWAVDAALTLADLDQLKASVEAYVMAHAVSWKPAVTMTVTSTDASKVGGDAARGARTQARTGYCVHVHVRRWRWGSR